MSAVIDDDKMLEVENVNRSLTERGFELAAKIRDDATMVNALEHGKEIDRRLKWWQEFIGPVVDSAHKAWKSAVSRRDIIAEPLKSAKDRIALAAGKYRADQDRKRREEEQRLADELKKQEEDKRLDVAQNLVDNGQADAADALLDEPVAAPTVILPSTPKVKGTSLQRTWKFRIVDAAKIPQEFLRPDEILIGQHVRTWKEKAQIPGVEVFCEEKEKFSSY